ncbi:MAG: tyrosine-type recombinase/integrase [Actinobacteria bacterium]|nr:tyrosine-type recombinase/integrase [Actinomycetota bacterium]MCB0920288.1 tyrosine-type recombinase/integrase [Actinomycetota bacterium]HRY08354.1 tyrosine-type recombinase/integrase [Candidatus Nanopelagicales bacterium]
MTTTNAHLLKDPDAPGVVLDDLLLQSWEIALRAERKSERTIVIYLTQARLFMDYCASLNSPARFDRRSVAAFLAAENARGMAGNTVKTRFRGLHRLAVWLADEGETSGNVMNGLAQPNVEVDPPPVLTDEQLKALLKACEGTRYYDRRDMAILRLLIDTGARASEIANLTLSDVNLKTSEISVVGKGSRLRVVPFGAQTARALDRYLRERRQHRHAAHSERLWIGERGPMTYDGIADALEVRAEAAGIDGFHMHLLRHTLAHRWLAAGGSELGLMDVAGWRSREMVARYGAAQRAARAQAEHRRLSLGDDL